MFKSLFISLNLVGLILLPFFYERDVTIAHDLPAEIKENSEVIISITINKGDISGPARLSIDFENAPGLAIAEVSNGGASYSFDNSSSLYVWYAIPSDETIILKYKITAERGSVGTKIISGTFSYLDGDERATKEIVPITFEVVDGNGEENLSSENSIPENTSNSEAPIEGKRTIEKDGNNYLVTIQITKEKQSGFARLKETIPAEFSATKVDAAGGVFKYTNNTVKFLWTKIPSKETTITVSYLLTPIGEAPEEFTITGYFSGEFLIVDDKPLSIDIPATTFRNEEIVLIETVTDTVTDVIIVDDVVVDDVVVDDVVVDDVVVDDVVVDDVVVDDVVVDDVVVDDVVVDDVVVDDLVADTGTTTTIITNSTIPISGILYRVQVLAAHKTVDAKYIKKRYNGYDKKLNLDNHEGWVKYTTNGMETYKSARDTRNSYKKYDFPGPFVTAYNRGERITVQEALMLSSQKWMP